MSKNSLLVWRQAKGKVDLHFYGLTKGKIFQPQTTKRGSLAPGLASTFGKDGDQHSIILHFDFLV